MLQSRLADRLLGTLLILLAAAPTARAQTAPAPWSGVLVSVSEQPDGEVSGNHRSYRHAISGDGRYVVFKRAWGSDSDPGDILVRDRYTGTAQKVNVAFDGSYYGPSDSGAISRNGKHVIFASSVPLTPDDTNAAWDLYARDLEHGTISRVSTGPNGEDFYDNVWTGAISNDGRFVAFSAQHPGELDHPVYLWLRDRDPDQNGSFDEPGLTSITIVSLKADGTPARVGFDFAINGADARFVAFVSNDADVVPGQAPQSSALYVRDRQSGTTFRIDQPPSGVPDYYGSSWPDFTDDGSRIVFSTGAPLTPNDPDGEDVYIFNIWTGGHTIVRLTNEPAATDHRVILPVISGDGRYVAVAAALPSPTYGGLRPWMYEVETAQSTQLTFGPPPYNPYNQPSVVEMSVTSDGSELLFSSDPFAVLYNPGAGYHVFVATPFDLTPSQSSVSGSGGTYTAQVSVRPDLPWRVTSSDPWLTVTPESGIGPGTLNFSVEPNATQQFRLGILRIGSRAVTVIQVPAPFISMVSPAEGPVGGGTAVSISGGGFTSGASVTFDGIAATSVTFVNSGQIDVVSPAHQSSGLVEVRVTNTDGGSGVWFGFYYRDSTAPVIDYQLEGSGSNGFYRSDVTIRWTVTDPESPVSLQGCETRTFTDDGTYYQFCVADSDGGSTGRYVDITRDVTAPDIQVWTPWYPPAQIVPRYPRGSAVQASYACTDQTSGVDNCTGDAADGQPINTSAAGHFTFTVNAQDRAGNQSTAAIPYIVVAPTVLTIDAASAAYLGSTTLAARLVSDGQPLAGQSVAFSINGLPVGTAVTDAAGAATLLVSLDLRPAGQYLLEAHFEETGIYATSDVFGALTIEKAQPQVTWAAPADVTYPTALSAAQLNATADVAGTFLYTPAPGTVLDAGVHVLSATFTPADSENYTVALATAPLRVNKATVTLAWSTPAPMVYGQALGAAQLNASAPVPGTFVYTPNAGSPLAAGSHLLSVVFTPSDSTNFVGASSSVPLTVAPAPLAIRANDAAAVYGAPLPVFSSTGTGFVYGETLASLGGTLTYSTTAGSGSAPGSYPVAPTGPVSSNYAIAFQNGVLTIGKASTTLALNSSPNPSNNNKQVQLTASVAIVAPGSGTPTGAVTFREGGTVLGTAPLVNGVSRLTVSFRKGTHSLTATWNGDANFVGSSGASSHVVN